MRRLAIVIALSACAGQGNAVPSTCPARIPSPGTACDGNLVCTYDDPCGGRPVARCTIGRWIVERNALVCVCPEDPPQRSAPCSIDPSQSCTWTNACGKTIEGSCGTDGWIIVDPGCP